MADIYIYSTQPLKDARGALEDDIDEKFAGVLEVSGGGAGNRYWNIDIALSEDADLESVVQQLVAFLREWGVPSDTYMHVVPSDWVEGQAQRRVDVFVK
jgi:hypothetical protein